MALDVREYWNFDDPAGSETVFRGLLAANDFTQAETLEVWAQIARTHGLQGDCPRCHELLDERWEEAMEMGGRAKGCFELERGRAFRSGKEVEKSVPFFESAAQNSEDDIRADALHMLAIIAEPNEGIRINLEALEFVKQSPSLWAQRWEGTLSNNLGWSYFDSGDYENALHYFAKALAARIKFGQTTSIASSKWCLGRSQRAAGHLAEALKTQLELHQGDGGGYVEEELGEIYTEQGKAEEAKPHFAKAVELLQDELGADSERVLRMIELS